VSTQHLQNRYKGRAFWSDADGGYIAICDAFPRLSAFGDTEAAALAELEIVLDAAGEVYAVEGWPLPVGR
jgi:predicted RNase H-like HicB family nuclease